jgi:hypothetical protein
MGRIGLILTGLILVKCVGTDHFDDPIVKERLVASPKTLALMLTQKGTVSSMYFNKYGVQQDIGVTWTSSKTAIATVDQAGVVSAVGAGQAQLFAQAGSAADTVQITVVGNVNDIAKVEISAIKTSFIIGESSSFSAVVKTINNTVISGKTIVWKSSNPSTVSIDANGMAMALANGSSVVTAEVEGVVSNTVTVTVGGARAGTFMKSGGYEATGTATLKLENNKLILQLGSDFKTSFALGTYIYLANNNTSGATIKTSGLEIQQITTNGAFTFDITAINVGVKLADYKYVIILCKPASVVFGYAELK